MAKWGNKYRKLIKKENISLGVCRPEMEEIKEKVIGWSKVKLIS